MAKTPRDLSAQPAGDIKDKMPMRGLRETLQDEVYWQRFDYQSSFAGEEMEERIRELELVRNETLK